ncbi:cytochrome d ubiquinol oxidase subunit II [Caenispirillum salinarum]|uniref:cytochrome d ubiquinol oxidase subunit II n=1 Tax=Caenispirillum salinarum TaxID=859058 RepID=UPI00385089BE
MTDALSLDLTLIAAGILAIGVFMYVLLDGFDLGIGILYPFAPAEHSRDLMMDSVAPVWDGNETWLVLGGTALLAAFPIAYAVLLAAFYVPLMVMLIGLIFRGVCFEFRAQGGPSKGWWSAGFFGGSLAATFAQGVVLGTFIGGVPVENGQYAGDGMAWAAPFPLLCGVGLVLGYALLGAGWTLMKTEGVTHDWAWSLLRPLTVGVLAVAVAVSVWTPFLHPWITARWFSWPGSLFVAPWPLLGLLCLGVLWYAQRRIHARRTPVRPGPLFLKSWESVPFLATMGLFLCSYAGLALTLWPYVIPPDISIYTAAAAPSAQKFVLVGLGVLVPVTIGYTAWSYWVFRGKVSGDAHY